PERVTIPIPIYNAQGIPVDVEYKEVMKEMPQMVYNAPYCEVLHNKMFVPHPHYKNIQEMPFVFCVYKKPADYFVEMAKQGRFRNIEEMGWPEGSNTLNYVSPWDGRAATSEEVWKSVTIEDAYQFTEDALLDGRIPYVDIVEGFGKWVFPEDETPNVITSTGGYKIKGKETDGLVKLGNYKVVLSLEKWPYPTRPFFNIQAYRNPELFWDIGIIELGKDIQEQYNTMGNARFQNAIMLVNQMMKVNINADIDPESLIPKPNGLIPLEDMNDVQPLVIPDATQAGAFREQEAFFEQTIEEMTGVYKYSMGATPPRQEHVGTIMSLQSMGEARTRLLLMTMDHQGFQPLLKYFMTLNAQHLPTGFEARLLDGTGAADFVPMFAEDLKSDYDFTARYTSMEPALGKSYRAQQLFQYAQMWQQSPHLNQVEFMKAIFELMDLKQPDRFLKTPEQM
ncbi:unnamed protein product, partial [marine sediment metagenome]